MFSERAESERRERRARARAESEEREREKLFTVYGVLSQKSISTSKLFSNLCVTL